MCEEWKNDFMAFYNDVGEAPSDEYQLDRIDNNGNYEPGNYRWVTRQENCRNRNVKVGKSGYHGVYLKGDKFQATFNIDRSHRVYLGTFTTAKEAYEARIEAIKKYNKEHNDNIRIY